MMLWEVLTGDEELTDTETALLSQAVSGMKDWGGASCTLSARLADGGGYKLIVTVHEAAGDGYTGHVVRFDDVSGDADVLIAEGKHEDR